MRHLRTLVLVLIVLTAITAHALDTPEVAKQKYDTLKVRALAGDTTVDWQELRLAAQVAGVNGDFNWSGAGNKAQAAFNEKNYEETLKQAQAIIAHNIASPEGHFDAMLAYKYLGKTDDQAKEKAFVDAIVDSILKSGDGKTARTAYFTVAISEEYFLLQVFGFRPKQQALSQTEGHAYDLMTVVDDDGKEHQLWFNTDTDMQIMARALEVPTKK